MTPTPEPLRVGLVGGGFMASVHTRAARAAGAQLVGAVGSRPGRGEAIAHNLGYDRGYDTIDQLLADPTVDVVHITTPNALHAVQAAAAIAAGKQVICEKPLATTVADAQHLTEIAEAAGVTAAVPFVYRFHPLVREARARFAAGTCGRLLTIQGSYLQDWLLDETDDNWRVDPAAGGRSRAFADIGSHLIDLIEFVTGDRVSRIATTTRTFFPSRAEHARVTTEDAAAVTLETSGGAIGTLLVSQAAPGRKNQLHLELAGSVESVAFDQEQPETLWIVKRRGSQIIPRDADQLSPDAARLVTTPAGHPQGYQDAFNAFVDDSYTAAKGGTAEGLPVFADGLRATQITECVLAAAEVERWIDVPAIPTLAKVS
ncbi:Gfo/Idh/MocA family protein [Microbacterium aurum]